VLSKLLQKSLASLVEMMMNMGIWRRPDTDGTQEAVSIASHQESAVKIEVMHYLDNPSKEISSLLAYPQHL